MIVTSGKGTATMRKKKKKIEIATADEVETYGGPKRTGSSEATTEASEPGPAGAGDAAAVPVDEAGAGEVVEGRVQESEAQPEDELSAARRKVEELTDKHLRAVAEHQNYVRRAAAERGEVLRYATADLIRSLLPVVDDFERTVAAVGEGDASPLAKGVGLVHRNLIKALEAHHVQRIESVGRPFDPSCHQAMMQRPTEDQPPGTVLEEYEPGYKLWDRVLRPAKVIVAKAVAEAEPRGRAEPDDEAAPGDETSPKDVAADQADGLDVRADKE